jgi:hypothetical protein
MMRKSGRHPRHSVPRSAVSGFHTICLADRIVPMREGRVVGISETRKKGTCVNRALAKPESSDARYSDRKSMVSVRKRRGDPLWTASDLHEARVGANQRWPRRADRGRQRGSHDWRNFQCTRGRKEAQYPSRRFNNPLGIARTFARDWRPICAAGPGFINQMFVEQVRISSSVFSSSWLGASSRNHREGEDLRFPLETGRAAQGPRRHRRTFKASSRLSAVWCASLPIPPSPIKARTSYGPTRTPGANAMRENCTGSGRSDKP